MYAYLDIHYAEIRLAGSYAKDKLHRVTGGYLMEQRIRCQIHSTIPATSWLPARVCMGGSYPSEGRQLHPEQKYPAEAG